MPNSRESAYIILFLLILSIAIYYKNARVHFFELLRFFFVKEILAVFSIMMLYSIIGVYVIFKLGLWDNSLIKDFIKWFVFSASVALVGALKTEDGKSYFRDTIIGSFNLMVIISFVLDKFTFNLFTEIVLVIVIGLINGVLYSITKDDKYKDVRMVFNIILSLISVLFLLNSLSQLSDKPGDFFNMATLKEFILPVFLSFWLIPFTYVLYLWKIYGRVYSNIDAAIKDTKLSYVAKIASMIMFKGDTIGLQRWFKRLHYFEIKTLDDIHQSILEIKERQKIEKNPVEISKEIGWSPFEAKDYLKSVGVETGFYEDRDDGTWSAISNAFFLDEIFSNYLIYHVNGDSMVAKNLTLVLNIRSKSTEKESVNTFVEYCNFIFFKVTGKELS
ncbi:hypothetical protein VF13_39275, partial [Nostoc linckia z16]